MTYKVVTITSIKEARLKFIDMARLIANLLILQGHFVTLTLKDYKPLIGKLISVNTGQTHTFTLKILKR